MITKKSDLLKKLLIILVGDLEGKKIAILGWSFKENTNDSRESASIYVSKILQENGAFLTIHDLHMNKSKILKDVHLFKFNSKKIKIFKNLKSALNSVDAAIIFNNQLEYISVNTKIVFDGRGILKNSIYSVGKTKNYYHE